MVAEAVKSRYEGKRLPRAKQAASQLLPVFPELLEEMQLPERTNRVLVRCPCKGGPLSEGMEKMSRMELLVAAHLHQESTMPGQTQWEEMCVVMDLSLSASSEMCGPSWGQGQGLNRHSGERTLA